MAFALRTRDLMPEHADPRGRLAALTASVTVAALRLTGRGSGTTLPGRLALRIDPHLIERLTRGVRVVLVSGTNGKTTTTRFVAAALGLQHPVTTNSSGSNLRSGVASALLAAGTAAPPPTAVLEVDEVALPAVAVETRPAVLVLLNLTRDQLDRTAEVGIHVLRWADMIRGLPGTVVVANADDPSVCAAVRLARPCEERVEWVGTGQTWLQDSPLCPLCAGPWRPEPGRWSCPGCGFARPEAAWAADGAELTGPARFRKPALLGVPGRMNVGNAAQALAAAARLGAEVDPALEAIRSVREVGGRYSRTSYAGRPMRLWLGKNPAGWSELLGELPEGCPTVVVVNARDADGHDTSWLWDVPFERLAGHRVTVSGERCAELSLRLRYADISHRVVPDPLSALAVSGGPGQEQVELVANYTAFRTVRRRLSDGGVPVAEPAFSLAPG